LLVALLKLGNPENIANCAYEPHKWDNPPNKCGKCRRAHIEEFSGDSRVLPAEPIGLIYSGKKSIQLCVEHPSIVKTGNF
jgi:hypothetical protein